MAPLLCGYQQDPHLPQKVQLLSLNTGTVWGEFGEGRILAGQSLAPELCLIFPAVLEIRRHFCGSDRLCSCCSGQMPQPMAPIKLSQMLQSSPCLCGGAMPATRDCQAAMNDRCLRKNSQGIQPRPQGPTEKSSEGKFNFYSKIVSYCLIYKPLGLSTPLSKASLAGHCAAPPSGDLHQFSPMASDNWRHSFPLRV